MILLLMVYLGACTLLATWTLQRWGDAQQRVALGGNP